MSCDCGDDCRRKRWAPAAVLVCAGLFAILAIANTVAVAGNVIDQTFRITKACYSDGTEWFVVTTPQAVGMFPARLKYSRGELAPAVVEQCSGA